MYTTERSKLHTNFVFN